MKLFSSTKNCVEEGKEDKVLKNDLNREKRLRRHAAGMNLYVTKGLNSRADKKINSEQAPGYMIADIKQGFILAGWSDNGLYQLNIDQAETFLSFYKHWEALQKLDLRVLGIDIKNEEDHNA